MNTLIKKIYGSIYLLYALICSVLLCSFSLASAPLSLSQYYQDHLTTRDGLPNNTIHAINQSSDGYLWFATWEGLARYNGHEFKNYTRSVDTGLRGAAQITLAPTERGLWIGGAKGSLSYYQDNVWHPQPKVSAYINHLLVDKSGFLWLATDGDGIYVRQGKKTIAHFNNKDGLPSNNVYQLAQDAEGRVWAGTAKGLAYIQDNTLYAIPELAGIKVQALLMTQQQQLLIGSAAGLYQAQQAQVHTHKAKLGNYSIRSLLEDHRGDLWIGTMAQGLLRLSGENIEQLSVKDGLLDSQIISLYQDTEDSIWLGTNVGLTRLREVPFKSFTERVGLANNYIRTVLAHSDGSIWAGSSTGLTRIEHGQLQVVEPIMSDGSPPSITSLVEAPNGEVWAGTQIHGLLRIDKHHHVHRYRHCAQLIEPEIRALAVGKEGQLWAGTASGLTHFKNGCLKRYIAPNELLSSAVLSLHSARNGSLWVGQHGGVSIIHPDHVTYLSFKSLLDAEYVFGIYAEPNNQYLWLTTDMGLVRYSHKDQTLRLVGKQHGLPVDKYFEVLSVDNTHLWLTSNIGMTRILLADAHQVADGQLALLKFEQFDESDGMGSGQTHGSTNPGMVQDKQGQIWVATTLGITYIDPKRLSQFKHTNLPVVIEEVKVAGERVPLEKDIIIPPGSVRIQFDFAGLGFVMPKRIHYRTKLEGFDKEWVARGAQNTAEYTNLAPGNYQFRVAAAYSYKDWNEQEVSLHFKVLPFIWQRPVFWIIVGIGTLVLFWLLMRLRLRFLLARTQELAKKVDEKTHELQQQAQEFGRQARIDSLTGLPNRRAFDEVLTHTFLRAKRNSAPLTLVVIDIDYFKHVNDTWSHAVGDQVLKIVADIIVKEIREVDIPARWGGEEFTVLLADTDISEALPICERVRLAVMNYDYSLIDEKFKLTISLGVAQGPLNQAGTAYLETSELLAQADQALYQAKHYGRNQVVVFNTKNAW
ncbi:ligand-binding sensor domain-containing diguanylate cyclase [Oceanisphaera avium]|uniref:diguanylate cyclase n=1 Tax=Oceanisphaera avium TaxID=1903694 RepID=A0A1Y0CU29_9GAMM|nr:ligand-binding sensor domain-containing diguanylate cyclase [Oceanisphaera avium]ART78853.1 hypothetical protein CBP12_00695 [Oceanisphaera avium]